MTTETEREIKTVGWFKGRQEKVLNAGYVKLIDFMGSDEEVIEAARMSTGKGFISWEPYENAPRGDLGLLETLMENRHTTPFECGGELHIEVQAPIFVFREWHRHRTQSYNEFSARYAQMPNLHYVPELDRYQRQSTTNKQGSAEPMAEEDALDYRETHSSEQVDIYANYDRMVRNGLAKEVARINTPVSRYSKMRAKTDIWNWLHFLGLRKPANAQWEIRQYADVVGDIIQQLWPRTYALFEEHVLNAVRFSASEMEVLRGFIKTSGIVTPSIWSKKQQEKFLKKLGL